MSGGLHLVFVSSLLGNILQRQEKESLQKMCKYIWLYFNSIANDCTSFVFCFFSFVFSLCWFPYLLLSYNTDRSQIWSSDSAFLFIPAFYAISSTLIVSAATFVQIILKGTFLIPSLCRAPDWNLQPLGGLFHSTLKSVCLRLHYI